MRQLVQEIDGEHLNDISYQVTIPQETCIHLRNYPKHRNYSQRECEGNKKSDTIIGIEFIDYHNSIYVAEGDETDSENAQGLATLGNQVFFICTKEHHSKLRPNPDTEACDNHRHGNKVERLT